MNLLMSIKDGTPTRHKCIIQLKNAPINFCGNQNSHISGCANKISVTSYQEPFGARVCVLRSNITHNSENNYEFLIDSATTHHFEEFTVLERTPKCWSAHSLNNSIPQSNISTGKIEQPTLSSRDTIKFPKLTRAFRN